MEIGPVGVGYAHGGSVHEAFMRSLINAWVWDSTRAKVICGFFSCGGLYVAVNRNQVCAEFLKKDGEWLWFLDTDMVFGEQDLYKLLESARKADAPIMSALYFGRMISGVPSTQPVWMREVGPGEYSSLSEFSSDVHDLDGIGMGCCIIHRSVLEKMREVYTQDEWTWFGHDVITKKDGNKTHLGEDLTFCKRARDLGFRVCGDGSIIVGHIKSRVENLDTFKVDAPGVEFIANSSSAA